MITCKLSSSGKKWNASFRTDRRQACEKLASMKMRAVIQSYTENNRKQAIFITKTRNAAFRRHTDDMRKASLIMKTMIQSYTENNRKQAILMTWKWNASLRTNGRLTCICETLASVKMRAVIQSSTPNKFAYKPSSSRKTGIQHFADTIMVHV